MRKVGNCICILKFQVCYEQIITVYKILECPGDIHQHDMKVTVIFFKILIIMIMIMGRL